MTSLKRYGTFATATLAGALALTGCGSDNNASPGTRTTTGGGNTAAAPAPNTGGNTGSGTGSGGGANCPTGRVNAEGSSAQQNAMDAWAQGFQEQCSGFTLNYNPSGSGAGIASFIAGNVAFAGSDSALKPEEQPKADARCGSGGKALNLPMVVGPVAVAYKLQGVDDLQLSPDTIAGIFGGKIKTWDAAEIKKDNPNATLPSKPIQAVHRSDESGTTDNFTKYLEAAAPKTWTFGTGKAWTAPGGQGAVKSAGVADAVSGSDGTIGYMEWSFAENKKLDIAKLGVGSEFVDLTAATAGKAVETAKIKGTGNDVALSLDYATKQAGAYPLVLVTYEITCEKGLPADQAKAVKSFLTYTASDAGQKTAADQGYAPLPKSVQQKVQQSVNALS